MLTYIFVRQVAISRIELVDCLSRIERLFDTCTCFLVLVLIILTNFENRKAFL